MLLALSDRKLFVKDTCRSGTELVKTLRILPIRNKLIKHNHFLFSVPRSDFFLGGCYSMTWKWLNAELKELYMACKVLLCITIYSAYEIYLRLTFMNVIFFYFELITLKKSLINVELKYSIVLIVPNLLSVHVWNCFS